MGAQEGIQDNIQINALGGTVTRRIIAGTYNNWSLGWTSNNIVTGTATVVIGNNLEGFGDRQLKQYKYCKNGYMAAICCHVLRY